MRLLLDAHLPVALAEQLGRHGVDAAGLQDWMEGAYLRLADDRILVAAHQDRRVLVTCDQRTVPTLLGEWAVAGRHHAGVILVAGAALRPNDVGGLLRALLKFVEARGGEDWEDRVIYLKPA